MTSVAISSEQHGGDRNATQRLSKENIASTIHSHDYSSNDNPNAKGLGTDERAMHNENSPGDSQHDEETKTYHNWTRRRVQKGQGSPADDMKFVGEKKAADNSLGLEEIQDSDEDFDLVVTNVNKDNETDEGAAVEKHQPQVAAKETDIESEESSEEEDVQTLHARDLDEHVGIELDPSAHADLRYFQKDYRYPSWTEILEDWPNHAVHEQKKIKKFTRLGIPDILRPQAWARLAAINPISSRSHEEVEKEFKESKDPTKPLVRHESYLKFYGHLQTKRKSLSKQTEEDIERDAHVTFKYQEMFTVPPGNKTTKYIEALKRVVHAYLLHNPRRSYHSYITVYSAFLLTYMSEGQVFWMLDAIMEAPPYNVIQLADNNAYSLCQKVHTVRMILQKLHPKLSKHLENLESDGDCFLYGCEWISTVFLGGQFQWEFVARVWDVFLHEGWKVLYRIVVALLACLKPLLKQVKTVAEANAVLERAGPKCNAKGFGLDVLNKAYTYSLRSKTVDKFERDFIPASSNPDRKSHFYDTLKVAMPRHLKNILVDPNFQQPLGHRPMWKKSSYTVVSPGKNRNLVFRTIAEQPAMGSGYDSVTTSKPAYVDVSDDESDDEKEDNSEIKENPTLTKATPMNFDVAAKPTFVEVSDEDASDGEFVENVEPTSSSVGDEGRLEFAYRQLLFVKNTINVEVETEYPDGYSSGSSSDGSSFKESLSDIPEEIEHRSIDSFSINSQFGRTYSHGADFNQGSSFTGGSKLSVDRLSHADVAVVSVEEGDAEVEEVTNSLSTRVASEDAMYPERLDVDDLSTDEALPEQNEVLWEVTPSAEKLDVDNVITFSLKSIYSTGFQWSTRVSNNVSADTTDNLDSKYANSKNYQRNNKNNRLDVDKAMKTSPSKYEQKRLKPKGTAGSSKDLIRQSNSTKQGISAKHPRGKTRTNVQRSTKLAHDTVRSPRKPAKESVNSSFGKSSNRTSTNKSTSKTSKTMWVQRSPQLAPIRQLKDGTRVTDTRSENQWMENPEVFFYSSSARSLARMMRYIELQHQQ